MSELRRSFQIQNALGFHSRAAAAFVQTASRFSADVLIERNGRIVNGKSLLGILLLLAPKGSEITVSTRGTDAEAALRALGALIDDKFGLLE